jgi:hypothetical protein
MNFVEPADSLVSREFGLSISTLSHQLKGVNLSIKFKRMPVFLVFYSHKVVAVQSIFPAKR